MEREKIEAALKIALVEALGGVVEDIEPESEFNSDLGADSLDCLEIVMSLEQEFDVDLTDADLESLGTFKAAVDYLENLLSD